MSTELLRTLATNFGSNSAVASKGIRELYALDPAGFPSTFMKLLGGPELPGTSYVIAMLVQETDWIRTICSPDKFTLEQSLHLVRRAHKLDPSTELKLAKMLAPLKFVTDEEVQFASRVLDVLERSPHPSTALPALRLMMECPNARLRSKAALLVGRINQNPQWADQGPSETDWRVSANAVESLWGLATPSVREAFLKAALHGNHRIAANGIVGLYRMGDECSIPFLFHLSRSETTLCRASAAWAMGYLEDPRFVPRLTQLISDPDEMIRKRAFQSVASVRQRMIQLRAAGAVQVQLRDVESRSGAHRIRFVATREGHFLKGLDVRQLVVWSGPDVVEELSCSRYDGPVPFYEVAYQGPPSPTHLVKVQVYAPAGVGEDTGFEMAFD